jgi:hypothetical protein
VSVIAEAPIAGDSLPANAAMSANNMKRNGTKPRETDDLLYLLGRSTLKQFLRFVRNNAIKPPGTAALIQEWQAAKERIIGLEKTEANCADNPAITPIKVDPKYKPLLTRLLKDPLIRNGFNIVPTEVAFIELDRLVVYQKHIDLTFVEQLKKQLTPVLTDEDLFRVCLPFDHPAPPVKWSRVDDNTYTFISPSDDIRFLGSMPLKGRHIKGYPHPGTLVGVVGLAVGFGSNFLNAFHIENRLILHNGSHRAYSLREMGYTHVPCIIQHVSTRDELDIVAPPPVRQDPDFYLKNQRPSMLKDYFNPHLRKVIRAHHKARQVTVRFSIEESQVPAFSDRHGDE